MSSEPMPKSESVIACNLNAIAADEREQHEAKVRDIFSVVQEIKEVSNGYAFRLPTDSAILSKAAEFITNERLCCPFFEFSIGVEANSGPIWLQLAGTKAVKDFIKTELVGNLISTVAPTIAIQS